MFTSCFSPLVFLLIDNCFGISLNEPKFDLQFEWNPNGTIFANETIVGKYPRHLFINNVNEIFVLNQETKQILVGLTHSCNFNGILIENLINSNSFFVNEKKEMFVDMNGKRIDQLTKNGTFIQTIISLNSSCSSLFIDHRNNLYCSIEDEHRVVKISLNENIKEMQTIAGIGCPGHLLHMLDHPNGIYVNENLSLFVADTYNDRIIHFHQNQTNGIPIAGFGSSSHFLLNKPTSLTFDGNSLLYIVDSLNHRIVRLISNEFQCLFGCSSEDHRLNNPQSISFDHFGNIFITDSNHHRILKFNLINNSIKNQTWKQFATTVAGVRGPGSGLNQLSHPNGMFIDDNDQTIVIADTGNHRIIEQKKNSNDSQIIAGGNGRGSQHDRFNLPKSVTIDQQNDSLIICDTWNRRVVRWPRRSGRTGEILISNIDCFDLMMDNDGYLYVADQGKHEIRRWKIGEENGTIVAGGNEQGNRLDQLNTLRNIFIDEEYSVYVSDYKNHRVMKWVKGAKEGIVVAGDHGEGNGLNQLSYPQGIIVDEFETLYVVDYGNVRVMRWLRGAEEGSIVVGGNGWGRQPNQLNEPIDLSFDRENNLYVVDYMNHRIQRFDMI